MRITSGDPETPAASLANVAAGADGNPRLAIRALGDAAVHGREPGNGQSEREDLLERAGRLGSTHRLVMAELIYRGEASPSRTFTLEEENLEVDVKESTWK